MTRAKNGVNRRHSHKFFPTLAMLRLATLSSRREETPSRKGGPEEALLLSMPSTVAMNVVNVIPIGANLMVMAKTTITFALSPCFEGKALLHLCL